MYDESRGPIDWRGRIYPADEPDPEDVLNQPDTISIEELREDDYDQLSLAGVSEGTPVDTFLAMQGNTSYVTEL